MKISLVISVMLSLHSAFESGPGDPVLLFTHTIAVQEMMSPSCVINPALLPFCKELRLSASGGIPYKGYGLDSAFSSVQYSGGTYGLSAQWNSFGCDFYRENTFSTSAGLAPFSWISAGLAGSCYMLDIDTQDETYHGRFYDWNTGLAVSPAGWLTAAACFRNINSMRYESPVLYGEWSFGLLIKPCRGLSVSWNITGAPAGRINTFMLNMNPFKYVSTGFGYSPDTGSFAASIGIFISSMELEYSIRIHPYLGCSHAVGISYNSSWSVEPLDYGLFVPGSSKRININTVTYEDLLELGFLSEKSARRIILYREQVGPVTRDALIAIGLLPEEIKLLAAVSYGFEEEKHADKREKTAYRGGRKKPPFVPRKERIKTLFKQMIDEGIPAYQAALYSDLSESDPSLFHERLQADSSLSDDQKKTIRRLCRK